MSIRSLSRQSTGLVALALSGLLSVSAWAAPRAQHTPGGVAVIPLGEQAARPEVRYEGARVFTIRHEDGWYAYVGIPLDARTGRHDISVNGKVEPFSVADKAYEEQHITITNTRKVDPNEDDLKRIRSERGRKVAAKTRWTDELLGFDFITPLAGPRTGDFGVKRFFNGKARNPHSGLDIAAPSGTPIVAPAAGTVIELGDFFFSGNMVYLDHGQGLISLYAHMSKIDVAVGDQVEQGAKLGEVGSTGRSTGPHLHWSVGLNGTWIDPALFLPVPD
ncbi:MAG: peptidoglycan DD-metalloendopeptidase family protein [Pseudomonadota bacterium]